MEECLRDVFLLSDFFRYIFFSTFFLENQNYEGEKIRMERESE